jgi:hypothetical protein
VSVYITVRAVNVDWVAFLASAVAIGGRSVPRYFTSQLKTLMSPLDPKPPAATVTYREVNKCERSHFRALALDIDCRQSRRSRLSRCLTAPELYEDLRVDPIVELAGHQIGTLLLQPLSLIAQLPTFQAKHIFAGPLCTFV